MRYFASQRMIMSGSAWEKEKCIVWLEGTYDFEMVRLFSLGNPSRKKPGVIFNQQPYIVFSPEMGGSGRSA